MAPEHGFCSAKPARQNRAPPVPLWRLVCIVRVSAWHLRKFRFARCQVALMPTELIILGYVVALLSGLGGLYLYSEQRHKRFDPTSNRDSLFRCQKCGYVYTDDHGVDLSRCPQCGKSNAPIVF